MRHGELMLEGAVADPERAIGRLDILEGDERHTILREWNATARAVPGATLPELFAAQVTRTPDADAIVFEDERQNPAEVGAWVSRAQRLPGREAPGFLRGGDDGRQGGPRGQGLLPPGSFLTPNRFGVRRDCKRRSWRPPQVPLPRRVTR